MARARRIRIQIFRNPYGLAAGVVGFYFFVRDIAAEVKILLVCRGHGNDLSAVAFEHHYARPGSLGLFIRELLHIVVDRQHDRITFVVDRVGRRCVGKSLPIVAEIRVIIQ